MIDIDTEIKTLNEALGNKLSDEKITSLREQCAKLNETETEILNRIENNDTSPIVISFKHPGCGINHTIKTICETHNFAYTWLTTSMFISPYLDQLSYTNIVSKLKNNKIVKALNEKKHGIAVIEADVFEYNLPTKVFAAITNKCPNTITVFLCQDTYVQNMPNEILSGNTIVRI